MKTRASSNGNSQSRKFFGRFRPGSDSEVGAAQRRECLASQAAPETEPVDLGAEIARFRESIGKSSREMWEYWSSEIEQADAEGAFDQHLQDVLSEKIGSWDWALLMHPISGIKTRIERDHVAYLEPEQYDHDDQTYFVKATYELREVIEGDRRVSRFRGIDIRGYWDFEGDTRHQQTFPEKVHPEELLNLIGMIEGSQVYDRGRNFDED